MVSVASNVLATIGTVLWCIQMIPQIIRNYKVKNCEGLPPIMLFLWLACGIPFSIYFVSIESSIPIQIQPQMFTALCLFTYAQVLYYPPISKPKRVVIGIVIAIVAVGVALEVGFIIPLKKLYIENGHESGWQHLVFGIIASILLALGLIPPYIEAYKRKGRIIGINFGFLAIDLGGAIFTLLSLAIGGGDIDIMGCVLYSICAALEIGIVICHLTWCMRFKWFGKGQEEKIEDEEEAEIITEPKVNQDDDETSLELDIEQTFAEVDGQNPKDTDDNVEQREIIVK